jgi:hypothetical protein
LGEVAADIIEIKTPRRTAGGGTTGRLNADCHHGGLALGQASGYCRIAVTFMWQSFDRFKKYPTPAAIEADDVGVCFSGRRLQIRLEFVLPLPEE